MTDDDPKANARQRRLKVFLVGALMMVASFCMSMLVMEFAPH